MPIGPTGRVTRSITTENTFTDPMTISEAGYVFVFITGATANADTVIQIKDITAGTWDTVFDYIQGDSTTGKYQKDVAIRIEGKPGAMVRAGILTGDYASGTVVCTIRDA